MKKDLSQLETFLAQGKLDEVQKLLADSVGAPLSNAEKGATLTGFASIYIDMMNSVQVRYQDALRRAIADIKRINVAELETFEKQRLSEVKKSLGM